MLMGTVWLPTVACYSGWYYVETRTLDLWTLKLDICMQTSLISSTHYRHTFLGVEHVVNLIPFSRKLLFLRLRVTAVSYQETVFPLPLDRIFLWGKPRHAESDFGLLGREMAVAQLSWKPCMSYAHESYWQESQVMRYLKLNRWRIDRVKFSQHEPSLLYSFLFCLRTPVEFQQR